MTETRRKLDAKHKNGLSGSGITGFVILGLSVAFFVAMGVSSGTKDAYGYTTGETIGMMVYALICLVIGGLMTLVTLGGGNRVDCHCVKCRGNASIGGGGDGGGSYSDDNLADYKDSVGDMSSKESEGSGSWDPFETFYERGFKDGVKREKEGPGAFDTFTDLLLASTDYNAGVKEGQNAARKNK
jgi:hypothetical protein